MSKLSGAKSRALLYASTDLSVYLSFSRIIPMLYNTFELSGNGIAKIDYDLCISCGKCSRACPMGLDVKQMVSEGINSNCTECIQCGACVDECPQKVLRYSMKRR